MSALEPFDVTVSGLAAGVNAVVALPDGTEAEVLHRAGDAGVTVMGLSMMRHPDAAQAGPDGLIVGFAAPAEHAFAPAVSALCAVLRATGL